MSKFFFSVFFAVQLVFAVQANGATVQAVGTVTSVNPALSSYFSNGDLAKFLFTIDEDAPGTYNYSQGGTASVDVNGFQASSATAYASVGDNISGYLDRFYMNATSFPVASPLGNYRLHYFYGLLDDTTGTVFDSTALNLNFGLSDFTSGQIGLIFYEYNDQNVRVDNVQYRVHASVNLVQADVAAVPVPASVFFMTSGLALMALRRRKRHLS